MNAPLADKIRPTCIEEMFGQQHLLGKDCALYNIVKSKKIPNMIFYGPSGTGKTTYARSSTEKLAETEPVPYDWCYVYNFQNQLSNQAESDT